MTDHTSHDKDKIHNIQVEAKPFCVKVPQDVPYAHKRNDNLDNKLFEYLDFPINSVMTMRKYLKIVNNKVPGVERICTHPKEDPKLRLKGLKLGLIKLGIRKNNR